MQRKPLAIALLFFGTGFTVVFFATLSLAMPLSGSDHVPEWVLQREVLQERLLRFLGFLSPYRSGGSITAAAFGAAVWAVLCSLVTTVIWTRFRARKQKNA